MVSLDFTPFFLIIQIKMGKNYQQTVFLPETRTRTKIIFV